MGGNVGAAVREIEDDNILNCLACRVVVIFGCCCRRWCFLLLLLLDLFKNSMFKFLSCDDIKKEKLHVIKDESKHSTCFKQNLHRGKQNAVCMQAHKYM